MSENRQFENVSERDSAHKKLAQWLQHVLVSSEQESIGDTAQEDAANELEVVSAQHYHLHFYRQLPNFILALLEKDSRATVQYAPLLYHLASCAACRTAYIELYDALGYALNTQEIANIHQGTRPMAAMPATALVHFCQLLITQAEAVLHLARHEDTDGQATEQAAARSLLQIAMHVSTQITQSSLRMKALHDLVQVATLSEGIHSPAGEAPATHSYVPLLGASGTRRGTVLRKADTALRSMETPTEPPTIVLQSLPLEGSITQHEHTLELHLLDLDEKLRGQYVAISIPLGALIEPVRWVGGNPRAIRSGQPVRPDGTLVMSLGETDLRLNDADERNLLEVMFLLLEVRPVS